MEVNKRIGVRVYIDTDMIESLICSMSTGSRYWCEDADKLGYENAVKAIMDGKMIALHDAEEDGKYHELTLAKIKRGLSVMAKKERLHFGDILAADEDQITADVLLQCSLFGEVLYS